MKTKLQKILLCFILFFLFKTSLAEIKNNIVVKVENEIITQYEIKDKIIRSLILSGKDVSQTNINSIKRKTLDFLIQNKLKKIELAKFPIEDDPAQINKYLLSVSNNNIENLKKKFRDNSLDFNLFRDEIKTQFKWQKLIYQIYSNKIRIDDKSLMIELENLVKNTKVIEEFKISEIEIILSGNLSDEEKISNVANQIKKNGFEDTALRFSDSGSASNAGDIGWVNSKSLSKPIYDLLKEMNKGDISKPIKKQNAVLFLKINDKRISKSENINISELKNNLINQKKNELFNLYSRSHLSKLQNTSLIEYK